MRVLVVEDHVPTTELLEELLGRDGHTVVVERDGIAGRDRALREPFDLILSDIGLPRLDGIALARAVRAAGIEIPLVALSGHTSDDERLAGLTAGFDSYLTKPITAAALLREIAVQEALHGRRRAAPRAAGADAVILPTPERLRPEPARRRGVLGGLVVIATGLPFVLQPLGVPNAASYLFLAMGLAFLLSYLRGRQYVYLIPMVTLTSFGIALVLPGWIVMRPDAIAPVFVAVVALGFVAAVVLAPDRRWPLVPAGLLGAVAAVQLVTGWSPIPEPVQPLLVPLVLVGVGVYLLVEPQG